MSIKSTEMTDKFSLTWNTFSSHLETVMGDLMRSRRHSDVTLVSEDQVRFPVHSFVLTASSTVFSQILDDSHKSLDQLIFLKGIEHQEIESLLQFMYLGVARFHQERVNQFLRAAKDLKIKNISDGVDLMEEEEYNTDEASTENGNKTEETNKEMGANVSESQENPNPPIVSEEMEEVEKIENGFKCPDCDKKFNKSSEANLHETRVHLAKKTILKNDEIEDNPTAKQKQG